MSERTSLTKEDGERLKVLNPDAFNPCPQCDDGWLQYRINTDEHRCALCDYSDRTAAARSTWNIETQDDTTA